jgi:hypothetical protein
MKGGLQHPTTEKKVLEVFSDFLTTDLDAVKDDIDRLANFIFGLQRVKDVSILVEIFSEASIGFNRLAQ